MKLCIIIVSLFFSFVNGMDKLEIEMADFSLKRYSKVKMLDLSDQLISHVTQFLDDKSFRNFSSTCKCLCGLSKRKDVVDQRVKNRFLNGSIIYTTYGDDSIDFPIRELKSPLEGTFDLSPCQYLVKNLSINTGYRKGKNPKNSNNLEIWMAPRFLIEKDLGTTAKHFKGIMPEWGRDAPVGLFWNWGDWDNMYWFFFLTTKSMKELGEGNLLENLRQSTPSVALATDFQFGKESPCLDFLQSLFKANFQN